MKRTQLVKIIADRLNKPDLPDTVFVKLVEKLASLNGWTKPKGKGGNLATGLSQAHRRVLATETREQIAKMTLEEIIRAKMQAPPFGVSQDTWRRALRSRMKQLRELSNQEENSNDRTV